ncbi:response regulator transcription factor [Allofournierella massiliensis]|uniref:Stage 0 sporulation protein A homolog n=1 Tax=Allofournierella massiliensis TaxID=1650663 RepID=A0A4R1QRD0_9FIRM|nr:response regulator transcription factor [Fournierella massiliensis]TCL53364.1 DNA-binding response OmpR family regulator [Fournierella massiliensis]
MPHTILIAEDDQDITTLVKLYLESSGYRVLCAPDGATALDLARTESIDMAVLDIMMPRMNGYELTRELRAISNMPILILSAKNTDNDKILGLELGADDYLTKPFNPLEIIARVKANLRRFYQLNPTSPVLPGSNVLLLGPLRLDLDAMSLTKNGAPISLTPTEYKILSCLMRAPGRIFTKVQLYEAVSGTYFESDENTMMVHISKLRDKIEDDPRHPCFIKTVRGLGYKIEAVETN